MFPLNKELSEESNSYVVTMAFARYKDTLMLVGVIKVDDDGRTYLVGIDADDMKKMTKEVEFTPEDGGIIGLNERMNKSFGVDWKPKN